MHILVAKKDIQEIKSLGFKPMYLVGHTIVEVEGDALSYLRNLSEDEKTRKAKKARESLGFIK